METHVPLAAFVETELHGLTKCATGQVDVALTLLRVGPALPYVSDPSICAADAESEGVLRHWLCGLTDEFNGRRGLMRRSAATPG